MIRNTLGCASAKEIAEHLLICDNAFVPRLSSRTDIARYAHKVFSNAQCFEAWAEDILVGLVAAYCDNHETNTAFITNVSVLPNWQGLGVATQLMSRCCQQVFEAGFKKIELQVSQGNKIAISFYEKHGFAAVKEENGTLNMILDFERNGR
ncbi:GNAT family N-acetyltransferase [Rhizobium viscosum]|uniref:Ribosomal-protein-alanine N-acetyltransferase n=1 Tax=Rhizobium viscosum TaxID=1673 RepID=A0ABR9IZD6_RHIVS|nr:GNAT family N-acetyltransferase [Rhizobium viscosum]MBE1508594.1 ribosomal-protein-alanine N-acetyltransferase [Rhizobium viscosum]